MRANLTGRFYRTTLLLTAVLATGTNLSAQILRSHTTEIGGFVGQTFGVEQTSTMGGGNICYSITREFMPFGEFSYFPGVGRTVPVSGLDNTTARFDLPVEDFNFGLHVRIPIPKSHVIPYGVISFGAIHVNSHDETITFPDKVNGGFQSIKQSVPSSTNYATSFGGGLRFYTGEHWGFRVEAKGYKPTGGVGGQPVGQVLGVFYRVTGGFFYQF